MQLSSMGGERMTAEGAAAGEEKGTENGKFMKKHGSRIKAGERLKSWRLSDG